MQPQNGNPSKPCPVKIVRVEEGFKHFLWTEVIGNLNLDAIQQTTLDESALKLVAPSFTTKVKFTTRTIRLL